MYREYKKECDDNNKIAFHRTGFMNLFHEKNFSLWQPRKDQCDLCCAYEAKNEDEYTYQAHIKRKTEAREAKTVDKELAENDPAIKVITMDLESLLICPRLQASSLYYKMKLSCHNFTIFDLTTKDVLCYFWNETEGDLTANCFASCVVDYLNTLNLQVVKKVVIYSDGCTYQNRNSTLANAILQFVVKNKITVEQKYLERGHTQMECDSIHSCVERKIKKKSVFVPQNYVDFIREARPEKPYQVKYLDHTFFKDFTTLGHYPSIRPGSGSGSAVVTDIRILKYLPEGNIQFKLGYTDEIFQDIPKPRATRTRKPEESDTVPNLYRNRISIKKKKYQHLQELKSVVPQDYQSFYDVLPHTP